MNELRFYAAIAVLAFQDTENRLSFADGFSFVHGEPGRFIDDQQPIVFKNGVDFWKTFDRVGCRSIRLERNVKLDSVAGMDQVIRFGSLTIDSYAVLAKDLSDIADRKLFFEKVFKLSRRFTGGPDNFLDVFKQIIAQAGLSQARPMPIFAILQALR